MATTTKSPARKLQIRRSFTSSPERLFAAWTTPEQLKRFHAPGPMTCTEADLDPKVGGRYRIVMRQPDGVEHKVAGTYKVVDPPRKLAYTWQWQTLGPGMEAGETLVTLEFIPKGTGTELVLTHEGFADDQQVTQHEQGWTAILDKLATQYK